MLVRVRSGSVWQQIPVLLGPSGVLIDEGEFVVLGALCEHPRDRDVRAGRVVPATAHVAVHAGEPHLLHDLEALPVLGAVELRLVVGVVWPLPQGRSVRNASFI